MHVSACTDFAKRAAFKEFISVLLIDLLESKMLIAAFFTLDWSLYKDGQRDAGGVSVPRAWDASWNSEDLNHFTFYSRGHPKRPVSATAPQFLIYRVWMAVPLCFRESCPDKPL